MDSLELFSGLKGPWQFWAITNTAIVSKTEFIVKNFRKHLLVGPMEEALSVLEKSI